MLTYEEIQTKCSQAEINSKDHGVMANVINQGRTKLVPTEVGIGTILEVLGLTAGNAFLDILYANTDFKYVRPLLEQGRLRVDSTLVRGTLDALVGNGLTLAQANSLKNLAVQDDFVTALEVATVLERGA